MTFDPHKNFAYSTVATAPSPATSGTTVTVQSGDGALFPNPSTDGAFDVVIWPTGATPIATNAEIARCTARSGDVLTITRGPLTADPGGVNRTVVVGDQIALAGTMKLLTDIEAAVSALQGAVVASLPASPTDGQEVYLQYTKGQGGISLWHMRYMAVDGKWHFLGGDPEIDYKEITTNVTTTSTNSAAPDDVIDSDAFTYDGNTRIKIEFWAAAVIGQNVILELYDGTTLLGHIGQEDISGGGTPVKGERYLTPSAGSHTFHIKAWNGSGSGTVYCAAGFYLPASLRISRA